MKFTIKQTVDLFEWLKMMREGKTYRFRDFKRIKSSRTGKFYSTKTIAAKLRTLHKNGLVKQIIVNKEGEKAVVGYSLSDKGQKALEILGKCEKELQTL